MAEIEQFLSPEAEQQIDNYIQKMGVIGESYAKLGTISNQYETELSKQASTQEDIIKQKEQLEKLNQAIAKTDQENLKTEQQLNKVLIEEEKLQQQKLRTAKLNGDQTKRNTSTIKELNTAMKAEVKTAKQATEQNKKLRDIRNRLDITSKSYNKRLATINKTIDKNNKLTATQADKEKRRVLGIGKYKEALQSLSPAAAGAIQGAQKFGIAMTLVLGPVGLVIAAIALVIGAFTAFFTSSEEGQNKLAELGAIFKTVIGNVIDLMSDLGRALMEPKKFITDLRQSFEDTFGVFLEGVINMFVSQLQKKFAQIGLLFQKFKGLFTENEKGITDAENKILESEANIIKSRAKITKGIDNVKQAYQDAKQAIIEFSDEQKREIAIAQALEARSAALVKVKREQLVQNAKNKKEIQDLLLAYRDENNSVEERRQLIREANELKRDELELNRLIALENYNIIKAQNALSNSNIDDLQREAEALAAFYNVQATNSAQLRELKNRENELDRKIFAEKAAEQAEIDAMINAEFDAMEENLANENEIYKQNEEDKTEIDKEQSEKRIEIAKLEQNAKINVAANAFSAIATLAGKETAIGKAAAIAATIINTYTGAQAAFAQTPGGIGIKTIAALSATTIGIANLRQIIGVDTSIPEYDAGKKSTPKTYIAGEKRPEIRKDKTGRLSLINKPTLFTDSLGDEIIGGSETERLLKNSSLNASTGNAQKDTQAIVNAIQQNRANMSIDKYGIIAIGKKNQGQTRWLNDKIRR